MHSVRLVLLSLLAPAALAAGTQVRYQGLLLDAATSGNAIVAVGDRGAILRSTDSGASWEAIKSPSEASLTSVAFSGAQGWIAGHDGTILATRDGGQTWTQQHSDKEVSFLDIAAADGTRATAVGAFGACYTTADGGATWNRSRILEEELHLNRIVLSADGDAVLAGERGTLLHRAAGKDTAFKPVPTEYEGSFFGLLKLKDGGLLACGMRGRIYRSDSCTAIEWQQIPLEAPVLLTTAIQLRSGTVVVAGQARNFFVSRDGGRTFQRWNAPLTTPVAELLEAPDGTLLAFGEAGVTRLPSPE